MRDERFRQIANLTADARVGSGETRAGQKLEEIIEFLALGEGVEKDRHRAEIERHRAQAEQMGRDARHFAADHADRLATRRQFPAHQFLDGERVGDVVRERREVIQPVRVGDELVVLHVLRDLFVAAMQIADIGRRLGDHLAIQLQDEPQNAMRRRMRRPHVEHHFFAEIVARLRICLRLHGAGERVGCFDFAA